MKHFVRIGLVVFFVLWASVAGAAKSVRRPFTLEECLRMALSGNHQISAATHRLDQAEGAVTEAGAPRYPRMNLQGGYLRIENPPSLPVLGQSLSLGRPDTFFVDLGVEQLLYSGGAVQSKLRAARRQHSAESDQYQALLEETALQVHRGFTRSCLHGIW